MVGSHRIFFAFSFSRDREALRPPLSSDRATAFSFASHFGEYPLGTTICRGDQTTAAPAADSGALPVHRQLPVSSRTTLRDLDAEDRQIQDPRTSRVSRTGHPLDDYSSNGEARSPKDAVLSSETLDALRSAERLLRDARRQIVQVRHAKRLSPVEEDGERLPATTTTEISRDEFQPSKQIGNRKFHEADESFFGDRQHSQDEGVVEEVRRSESPEDGGPSGGRRGSREEVAATKGIENRRKEGTSGPNKGKSERQDRPGEENKPDSQRQSKVERKPDSRDAIKRKDRSEERKLEPQDRPEERKPLDSRDRFGEAERPSLRERGTPQEAKLDRLAASLPTRVDICPRRNGLAEAEESSKVNTGVFEVSVSERPRMRFRVQTGPRVDIRSGLTIRSVENYHISPRSSSLPVHDNVATYQFRHDSFARLPDDYREKICARNDSGSPGSPCEKAKRTGDTEGFATVIDSFGSSRRVERAANDRSFLTRRTVARCALPEEPLSEGTLNVTANRLPEEERVPDARIAGETEKSRERVTADLESRATPKERDRGVQGTSGNSTDVLENVVDRLVDSFYSEDRGCKVPYAFAALLPTLSGSGGRGLSDGGVDNVGRVAATNFSSKIAEEGTEKKVQDGSGATTDEVRAKTNGSGIPTNVSGGEDEFRDSPDGPNVCSVISAKQREDGDYNLEDMNLNPPRVVELDSVLRVYNESLERVVRGTEKLSRLLTRYKTSEAISQPLLRRDLRSSFAPMRLDDTAVPPNSSNVTRAPLREMRTAKNCGRNVDFLSPRNTPSAIRENWTIHEREETIDPFSHEENQPSRDDSTDSRSREVSNPSSHRRTSNANSSVFAGDSVNDSRTNDPSLSMIGDGLHAGVQPGKNLPSVVVVASTVERGPMIASPPAKTPPTTPDQRKRNSGMDNEKISAEACKIDAATDPEYPQESLPVKPVGADNFASILNSPMHRDEPQDKDRPPEHPTIDFQSEYQRMCTSFQDTLGVTPAMEALDPTAARKGDKLDLPGVISAPLNAYIRLNTAYGADAMINTASAGYDIRGSHSAGFDPYQCLLLAPRPAEVREIAKKPTKDEATETRIFLDREQRDDKGEILGQAMEALKHSSIAMSQLVAWVSSSGKEAREFGEAEIVDFSRQAEISPSILRHFLAMLRESGWKRSALARPDDPGDGPRCASGESRGLAKRFGRQRIDADEGEGAMEFLEDPAIDASNDLSCVEKRRASLPIDYEANLLSTCDENAEIDERSNSERIGRGADREGTKTRRFVTSSGRRKEESSKSGEERRSPKSKSASEKTRSSPSTSATESVGSKFSRSSGGSGESRKVESERSTNRCLRRNCGSIPKRILPLVVNEGCRIAADLSTDNEIGSVESEMIDNGQRSIAEKSNSSKGCCSRRDDLSVCNEDVASRTSVRDAGVSFSVDDASKRGRSDDRGPDASRQREKEERPLPLATKDLPMDSCVTPGGDSRMGAAVSVETACQMLRETPIPEGSVCRRDQPAESVEKSPTVLREDPRSDDASEKNLRKSALREGQSGTSAKKSQQSSSVHFDPEGKKREATTETLTTSVQCDGNIGECLPRKTEEMSSACSCHLCKGNVGKCDCRSCVASKIGATQKTPLKKSHVEVGKISAKSESRSTVKSPRKAKEIPWKKSCETHGDPTDRETEKILNIHYCRESYESCQEDCLKDDKCKLFCGDDREECKVSVSVQTCTNDRVKGESTKSESPVDDRISIREDDECDVDCTNDSICVKVCSKRSEESTSSFECAKECRDGEACVLVCSPTDSSSRVPERIDPRGSFCSTQREVERNNDDSSFGRRRINVAASGMEGDASEITKNSLLAKNLKINKEGDAIASGNSTETNELASCSSENLTAERRSGNKFATKIKLQAASVPNRNEPSRSHRANGSPANPQITDHCLGERKFKQFKDAREHTPRKTGGGNSRYEYFRPTCASRVFSDTQKNSIPEDLEHCCSIPNNAERLLKKPNESSVLKSSRSPDERTEASSESCSEGEFHWPSSGSYSIGEVRVSRKDNAYSGNAIFTDLDGVAVFVTKSVLNSSLAQSLGEVHGTEIESDQLTSDGEQPSSEHFKLRKIT